MPRSPKDAIQIRERKELDATLYSSVDAFLKPLRTTTRRLQVASTVLGNEEQLLQRIYYKGKNQHRSALFWRRATELRRYSDRMRRLNLGEFIQHLRCSFFGEEALTNQNLLKGAWAFCPDVKSLDRALDRCREAQTLVTKFESRSMDTYSSFTTSMQSGAFIQILLVLAAISARLRSVAQEYQDILSGLLEALRVLKAAVTVRFSCVCGEKSKKGM